MSRCSQINLDGRSLKVSNQAYQLIFNSSPPHNDISKCTRDGRCDQAKRPEYVMTQDTCEMVMVGSKEYVELRCKRRLNGREEKFCKDGSCSQEVFISK